jgi:hypothetical protein
MRPKGTPKTGGRVAGTPNRATTEFRDTVRQLLDDNAENVKMWLTQVASDDPYKALSVLSNLAEYAAPKLSRTESHVSLEEKSHEEWLNGLE